MESLKGLVRQRWFRSVLVALLGSGTGLLDARALDMLAKIGLPAQKHGVPALSGAELFGGLGHEAPEIEASLERQELCRVKVSRHDVVLKTLLVKDTKGMPSWRPGDHRLEAWITSRIFKHAVQLLGKIFAERGPVGFERLLCRFCFRATRHCFVYYAWKNASFQMLPWTIREIVEVRSVQ